MSDDNENKDKNQIENQEDIKKTQQTYEVEETPENLQSPESFSQDGFSSPPVFKETNNQMFIMVAGIIIFLFFFFLIFKGLFSKKPTKNVTLTYWGLWEEKEVFQPLIDEYQQKNPHVKINYEKMSPENYREKIIARSKNNKGPDIFRFHNTWVYQLKEVLAPIPSKIMTNEEFEKTFYKIHQKDLKVGNYYYGLPLTVDGLVLVCNENLFKKAGIDYYPSTWDDVVKIAPQITVKDQSNNLITSGIAIGTTNNIEHFSDILGLLFLQNGVNLSQLETPEAAAALEAYRHFAEKQNGIWDENMPNSLTAFIQEKVAMIIVPSWQILSIKAANPEIKIKVLKVPSVPGGSSASLASYWVEGVSRYSQNQIEAWKFLKFLTEKENLTKLYQLQTKYRLFGEPYSRVDLGSLLVQNEYIGAVIKQAENYQSLPLISRTFDNGLNDEIIKYLENAINSTAEGVSYAEALKTAQSGIKQVYDKFGIPLN